MNHVPDAVLARLDTLGRSALAGDPVRIRAGLRTDLRLAVDYDGSYESFDVRFYHAEDPRSELRDHGSWLATYVDGVDRRLTAWGFRPPGTYHSDTGVVIEDPEIAEPASWVVYRGSVGVPGE